MEQQEAIDKAEKMLIGIQLISENVDDVIASGLASHNMKYKLKNLANRCLEIEKGFWQNMDEAAQLEFQRKIKTIEDLL